jgi:hypothetical protein
MLAQHVPAGGFVLREIARRTIRTVPLNSRLDPARSRRSSRIPARGWWRLASNQSDQAESQGHPN